MTVADTLVESADGMAKGRGKTHVDPVGAFVPVQSRAERTASFDLADFPVPKGREEEWRFTPVKKLAALLAEGSSPVPSWATELPEGVTTSRITLAQARELGILPPQDRAAAVAAAGAAEALFVDIAPHLSPGEGLDGYTHTPGVRNVLRIKRYQRTPVPADASAYLYVLDLVVESETVKP